MNYRTLPLDGQWTFAFGPLDAANDQRDEPTFSLPDTIQLPGTTGTDQKGPENPDRPTGRLSQPHLFVGPCSYSREVEIPEAWAGRRVVLHLERTKFARVWFDGEFVGEQAWICTPHEYEITGSAVSGRHRLTIMVDNRQLPPYGSDAHQISENTQGNWNGIIGRIELKALDSVAIASVRANAEIASRTVDLVVDIANAGPRTAVRLQATALGLGVAREADEIVDLAAGEQTVHVTLPLGPEAALWDEFHPNMIRAEVSITADGVEDRSSISFGLRDFRAVARHFEVNGRPVFLRGRHDGCVFPLTGHPPMDKAGWLSYFRTCREYGLNHVRFHTWTPPDAAFEAADELGFYLQPELPFWGDFTQEAFDALLPEAERILRSYGNHPSFVMFSLGNEHWGGAERMDEVIRRLKEADARRLYVRGTCAFWPIARPGSYDDYIVFGDVKSAEGEAFQVRGANLMPWGHVQRAESNTLIDYRRGAEANDVPTISHEIGQYTVYPDFDEIDKYTGVTKPYNLMAFRDKLDAAGMLDQNKELTKASGALAALCYRAEIEACLRTPEYGGFEILDLQDFPGQGTALVGMLDAFMDSKDIVTPEQWRRFCAPSTLLARFAKYVWKTGEDFEASVALSHFGPKDLPAGKLTWRLADDSRRVVALGTSQHPVLQTGGLRQVADLAIPLASTGRFTLKLTIDGTDIVTSYPLWVYPDEQVVNVPHVLLLARGYDGAVRDRLADGGSVLVVCDDRRLARSVGGGFASDFWNFQMFHGKPGTMGLICDPKAPALASFPNDGHSDWQWSSIVMKSQPVILDSILPKGSGPTVQVIDNYVRCHKLALIFELRVGNGRLLVCTADLLTLQESHPEARALLLSLIEYASSGQFSPQTIADFADVKDLLSITLNSEGWKVSASSVDSHWHGYQPEQIIDGSEYRGWRAAECGEAWCRIDFPAPVDLDRAEIVWPVDASDIGYVVECSVDGEVWTTLHDCPQGAPGVRHRLTLRASDARALRVRIQPKDPAAVAEIMELYLFDR